MPEKGLHRLKTEPKRGDAMIVVLCVLCVFIMLSFTLLLASAVLTAAVGKQKNQEQCRLSAITFSELIRDDLTSSDDSSLKDYLKGELQRGQSSDWYYYNEDGEPFHNLDSAGVIRVFDFADQDITGSASGAKGDITVEMYWQIIGETAVDDPDDLSIRLVVVTECGYNGETFRQKSFYDRRVQKTGEEGEAASVWSWGIVWKE